MLSLDGNAKIKLMKISESTTTATCAATYIAICAATYAATCATTLSIGYTENDP